LLVTLLLALSLGTPATAAELDPVVADVIRMLEEGVDSQFIAAWLDRPEVKPVVLTPDDLIALSKAKAPQELIKKLMGMSPKPAEAAPPPPKPAPPPVEQPPAERPAALSDTIVQFVIDYRPGLIEDQTNPWDLWVYLDGAPLARSSGWAVHSATHMEKSFVERKLAPGRHEVRLLQEQHLVKSQRKGTWSHNARVFPTVVLFDIDAAGSWKVEIQVDEEGVLHPGRKSPVNYIITRDGDIAEQGVDLGPATRKWPLLCEEVATRFSGDKLHSRAAERAMGGCMSWSSLWSTMEEIPDRATVRENMRQGNFKVVDPG
jgi:hypothetical protein